MIKFDHKMEREKFIHDYILTSRFGPAKNIEFSLGQLLQMSNYGGKILSATYWGHSPDIGTFTVHISEGYIPATIKPKPEQIMEKELEDCIKDIAAGTGASTREIYQVYKEIDADKPSGPHVDIHEIRWFANLGIPIYKYLAKHLNVQIEQVQGKVCAGLVQAADVKTSLLLMASPGEIFHGLGR